MNQFKNLILAAICVGFLCTGCANYFSGSYAPLVSSTHPEIQDIPIPMGFELDRDESESNSTQSLRIINYVYTGNSSVNTLVKFYEKQMEQYNWGSPNKKLFEGLNILTFTKGSEICTITISRSGGILPKTYLKIKLMPNK